VKRGSLQIGLIAAVGLVLLLAIALATVQAGASGGPVQGSAASRAILVEPDAGPDLTAEIEVIPASPAIGQPTTIRVTVRNKGTAGTGAGFTTYLYVNPPDRPPTNLTPGYPYSVPALAAGGSYAFERTNSTGFFNSTGCDHVVYAWADKANAIAESDETNNLVSLQVCVGVTCAPDAYEPDSTCADAGWSSTGAVQDRTLCPVGDEDWIKFTAIAGTTYTVSATDLGMHAVPLLSLYKTCGGLSQFGTGPQFQWFAPDSGAYYIHVRHHDDTYGPLANYKLRITADAGPGDAYEPDDTCAAARDIATNGTRQTHLFQGAGDQDWVKFSIQSGDSFQALADNTGQGVSPLISVYASCDQIASAPLAQGGGRAAASAWAISDDVVGAPLTSQVYYAKVVNGNTNVYGPEAHYDLRVQAIPCAADAHEEDDTSAAARTITVDDAAKTHNTCPAGDEDWVKFTAEAGTTYVLHTSNLGIAADTYLYLYGTDGATELAKNDDYGYLLSSRIVWQAPQSGAYYAKVRHHNPQASGVDTHYDLAVSKGSGCAADAFEPDNGALDARAITTNGAPQSHSFCAGADLGAVGDQDWVRFDTLGGATYLIQTANLGPQSDTILEVYDRNMVTLLTTNDDAGLGQASTINFVAPSSATYYVRVKHFNASQTGDGTEYHLAVTGAPAPTPTPTATATATSTPTPTATPLPNPHKTLILVNSSRMAALYGQPAADALLAKLYTLADHDRVLGEVAEVRSDPAVAAAYDAWTASSASLLDTAKANAVAGAVRNLTLTFFDGGPNIEYVVLVGGDQVIPHRRVPEGTVSVAEQTYAASVTANTTLWAAVNDNMTMTDDYYVDREPTDWQGRELYIPDYAIGRLVETPAEITGQIDLFLANPVLSETRALVTGYHVLTDVAQGVALLLKNDGFTTDDTLVGISWAGNDQRTKMVNTTPRFAFQSINTHADHQSFNAPDSDKTTASQVVAGTGDLARAIVFSTGCHAGFNDSGSLDLPQAFVQKGAIFVGNTGFGWGGNGLVYSEKLIKNFAYSLLSGTSARIGKALAAAKRKYYQTDNLNFKPYDEKVIMQATLYGLPMYEVTSSQSLEPEDPFPSVAVTPVPPSAFGPVAVGSISLGLIGSFGAFDENTTDDGTFFAINDSISFDAGAPIQPRYYASLSAAQGGDLHGAVFLGGVYKDVAAFDPVVALPENEYVTSTAEPAFSAVGWYPSVPFLVRSNSTISSTTGSLVSLLGQFNDGADTQRVYDHMSFATYFSASPDAQAPVVKHVDGVLVAGVNQGRLKVEAEDPSGVLRVVAAFTDGTGSWQSQDLTFSATTHKWTGSIPATQQTRYFVQIVDGAGNVAVDENKGSYFAFAAPVPLAPGHNPSQIYLPVLMKGG
jgi:hypothetical protein